GPEPWILALGSGQGLERHFGGQVGVSVDDGLESAFVHLDNPFVQVVLRHVCHAVCKRLVVAGPEKQRGVALDRSVNDKLDAAKAEAVIIAFVKFGEIVEPALVGYFAVLKNADQWIENY